MLACLTSLFACDDGGGTTNGDGDADSDSDHDAEPSPDSDAEGDAESDSALPDADDIDSDTDIEPGEWPPYERDPQWIARDRGYATGAGFADIDGDGLLDLVIANGNDMALGPLMVYHAGPEGMFPRDATWRSETVAYHGHLATGDINGDGWTDVVVSVFLGDDSDAPGSVALYLNEEGELPSEPSWMPEEGFYTFSLALGDIDNDGDLDLAVAVGEPFFHDPGPNRLYENRDGVFLEPPAWTSEPVRHSSDVVFLDADGDGALDLAFANAIEAHTLFLNQGDGSGGAGLPSTTPDWEAAEGPFEGNTLDFGDVNGDGHVDLVISDNDYWLHGRGTVSLFCGPAFDRCWESEDPPVYQSAVALADLDGDEDLDLVAGGWWAPLRFYRNQGGLETTPSAWAADDALVTEAFIFHDLDGSHTSEESFTAEGPLVELPRRCQVVSTDRPAAVGDGYLTVTGGGMVNVTCRTSTALDFLVSDWTEEVGSQLYLHRAGR